jgi:hypothetical protein
MRIPVTGAMLGRHTVQCATHSQLEPNVKFTSQVQPNRLKSMDARDQRDRQQFH